MDKCSICKDTFDLKAEGGIEGLFGMNPIAFCVWCYSNIVDMVKQRTICWCEEE